MALYEFNGKVPLVGEGTWIASSSEIIGDVTIGKNCWIGPCAVIRGDFGSITIDDETAIEDGVVIHTPASVSIGTWVTIGHLAMIHGSNRDEVEAKRRDIANVLGDACNGNDILYSTRILKKTGFRLPASEG